MTQSFVNNDSKYRLEVPSNFRVALHSQILKREHDNSVCRQFACLFIDEKGGVLELEIPFQDNGENKACSTFPELDESKWIGGFHAGTSNVLVFNNDTCSFTDLDSYENESDDSVSTLMIDTVGIAQDIYNAARNGDELKISNLYVADFHDYHASLITFIYPTQVPLRVIGVSSDISEGVEEVCDEKQNTDHYLNDDD